MTNTTLIDICNAALAEIGHDVEIASFEENSAEAAKCRMLLPVARRVVFAGHPWSFLTLNPPAASLELEEVEPLPGYDAVYCVPADTMLVVGAFDNDDKALAHMAVGGYTHVRGQCATLRYTRMVEESEGWNAAGVMAVTSELAYRLGRVMKVSASQLASLREDAGDQLKRSLQIDAVSSRRKIGGVTSNRYRDLRR